MRFSTGDCRGYQGTRSGHHHHRGSVALTVGRAAKALDCGRSTIYRRIDSGELEVVRFDGRPKITARSIIKLLGIQPEESTESDQKAA